MRKIGLTGGIGSGKSTAAQFLQTLGAAMVDADALSRTLTAAGGAAIAPIAAHFGASMITRDGAMDRVAMRERVFSQPQARRELEAILHPLIAQDMAQQCEQHRRAGYTLVIHDIPLLTESASRWRPQLDAVWVVDCTPEQQVQRVMSRSAWTTSQVQAVIAAQASRAQRLAIADAVIGNHGNLAALHRQLTQLWQIAFAAAAQWA